MLQLLNPLNAADRSHAESSFRGSCDAYLQPVVRYVARLSGDPGNAEDLAQEVFVRFWRELSSSGEPPNPRAWLFRVAGNLVLSGFRTKSRAPRVLQLCVVAPDSIADRADTEADVTRRQVVERVLRRLPEPMRQCLLLHHEGLTGREIAEVLKVKASYVGTLVFRAHERFRRECQALGGHDGLL